MFLFFPIKVCFHSLWRVTKKNLKENIHNDSNLNIDRKGWGSPEILLLQFLYFLLAAPAPTPSPGPVNSTSKVANPSTSQLPAP